MSYSYDQQQIQELNISSREFLKKAEFVNVKTLTGGKEEEPESPGDGD